MEGYVKNITPEWSYAMKRTIKPGGEVPLDELYRQYGKKHGMKPNEEFVKWLQDVKLKNRNRWQIVYDFGDKGTKENKPFDKTKENDTNINTPIVPKKMSVEDVVNLTVRKARDELPKINDIKLLKYALAEARQLSDKDSLCQLLHRRIRDLKTTAR